MQKCVFTGQETDMLNNGVPCSREGRELLNKVHTKYNEKMKQQFIEKAMGRAKENAEESGEEVKEDILRETFAQLAPQISKKNMLKYIKIGVGDALQTLEEVKNENNETLGE